MLLGTGGRVVYHGERAGAGRPAQDGALEQAGAQRASGGVPTDACFASTRYRSWLLLRAGICGIGVGRLLILRLGNALVTWWQRLVMDRFRNGG